MLWLDSMAWIAVIAKSKATFFRYAFVVDWTEIVGIVGTAEDAKEVDVNGRKWTQKDVNGRKWTQKDVNGRKWTQLTKPTNLLPIMIEFKDQSNIAIAAVNLGFG